MEKITAAIIAGGMSRRFGADKTLALLDGKPLIQWVFEGVQTVCDEVIIISKNSAKYAFLDGARFVEDIYEQQCALVGLLTGLKHAGHDSLFLISADMPMFPYAAIPLMLGERGDADVILPCIGGKHYPCAALYRKRNFKEFEDYYMSGKLKMMDAIENLRTVCIGHDLFAPYDNGCGFINVNTPQDLETIHKRCQK